MRRFQNLPQGLAGMTGGARGDLLWSSFGDEVTTLIPGLRPKINDPICRLDHLEDMFDHQHRVTGIHEPLKDFQQHPNVLKVQAGGRFVEEKKR